jgi:hypothetical protein
LGFNKKEKHPASPGKRVHIIACEQLCEEIAAETNAVQSRPALAKSASEAHILGPGHFVVAHIT